MALKVTKLPTTVYVKEIDPANFDIRVCDCAKRNVPNAPNYFNLGYFAAENTGKTVVIGNVKGEEKVYSESASNATWINVARKNLTTIYTTEGTCGMMKTSTTKKIAGCKTAISGIPIIVNGAKATMSKIKSEGYFGTEIYDTWHGFLGIRNDNLVYVAAKCGYEAMYPLMVSLGIRNAIKLDGGGSFILKENGVILQSTSGNRRINTIGIFK